MELSATSDLEKLPDQLAKAAAAVGDGQDSALDEAGKSLLEAKLRNIGDTYDRPERRLKSGKPAWKRTGAWRDGQKARRGEDGTVEVYTDGPAADYEGYVAKLRPGPDGVNRSNNATERTQREMEDKVRAEVEKQLEAKLSRL